MISGFARQFSYVRRPLGRIVTHRGPLVAGVTFLSLFGAIIFMGSVPAQYKSTATIAAGQHVSDAMQAASALQSPSLLLELIAEEDKTQNNNGFRGLRLQNDQVSLVPVSKKAVQKLHKLRADLDVEPVPDSGLVHIHFKASDPDIAALIANKIANEYVRATRAQIRLPPFSDADKDNASVLPYVLPFLQQNSLLLAQQFKQAQTKPEAGSIGLAQLSARELEIEQKLAGLRTRYGARHPELIATEAELLHIQSRIAALTANKSDIPDSLEASRDPGFTDLQVNKKGDSQNPVSTITRFPYIISQALPAESPYFPAPGPILTLALVVGVLAGVLIAFAREGLADGWRSARQLEMQFSLPCIALVPRLKIKREKAAIDHVLENPAGQLADSLRSLRVSLDLQSKADNLKPPKVLALTSTFPDEGKTTLSGWLGRVSANGSEKTIIIDCDLRRPRLQKLFGFENGPGLTDYLSEQAGLEEIVQTDPKSGAHVICTRAMPSRALEFLRGKRLKQLVETLRKAYDCIILDGPASLMVADAKLLSELCDSMLYVVAWNKTPRHLVVAGTEQLRKSGASHLTFVLNKVDMRRFAAYGYNDPGQMQGSYEDEQKN